MSRPNCFGADDRLRFDFGDIFFARITFPEKRQRTLRKEYGDSLNESHHFVVAPLCGIAVAVDEIGVMTRETNLPGA